MADVKRVERPLSPHLQIYRWQVPMLTSILTRITGHALVAGVLLGVWWLLAAATSEDYFASANAVATSWFGDLVFTGTPKASGLDKRVSVSVDLSLTGPDQTTLVLTATGILTGPNTADQPVPDDKLAAVLKEFSTTITGQKLPFGIAPTSQGARGSDIIIEGIAQGVTVDLNGFRQS